MGKCEVIFAGPYTELDEVNKAELLLICLAMKLLVQQQV